LYGAIISTNRINTVKERVATILSNGGKTSLIDAAIEPISAPMFIVFAIRRRLAIGKTTFLEYLFFITQAKPLPVTRPILAHIS